MEYFTGLDVSVDDTSICIVDAGGRIVRETKVPTDPAAIVAALSDLNDGLRRIGLEAGPLSQWLYAELADAELPVICVETRHMQAALAAQPNKSDRSDARGMAQMMRVGLYRPVHVKTPLSQERRMLLTSRKLLLNKLRDVENDLRGTLKNFGLRVGSCCASRFDARIRELVADKPRLQSIVAPVLAVRTVLLEQSAALHKMLLAEVRNDIVCRRLMTVPGVGPVVALTFRATVDVPARFARSRSVGAHFGLVPRRYQSGEIDRSGRISKCGDGLMRTALFEAAQVLLTRVTKWCALKAWGLRLAKRSGMRKAITAVARRLAIALHRIWTDGSEFRWTAKA